EQRALDSTKHRLLQHIGRRYTTWWSEFLPGEADFLMKSVARSAIGCVMQNQTGEQWAVFVQKGSLGPWVPPEEGSHEARAQGRGARRRSGWPLREGPEKTGPAQTGGSGREGVGSPGPPGAREAGRAGRRRRWG